MTMDLDAALDRLDAVVPVDHPVVGGCTLCYTPEELATLEGPRERVPDEVVARVAREVTDHWDDFAGLYRWLAARSLRTLIRRPDLTAATDDVGLRFVEAGWRSWSRPEVEAIEDVLRVWWLVTIRATDPEPDLEDTLEFLTVATGELAPWLRVWADTPYAVAGAAELREVVGSLRENELVRLDEADVEQALELLAPGDH